MGYERKEGWEYGNIRVGVGVEFLGCPFGS